MLPLDTSKMPPLKRSGFYALSVLHFTAGAIVTLFCVPYLIARALIGSFFKK